MSHVERFVWSIETKLFLLVALVHVVSFALLFVGLWLGVL